jgi:hypothetical protein
LKIIDMTTYILSILFLAITFTGELHTRDFPVTRKAAPPLVGLPPAPAQEGLTAMVEIAALSAVRIDNVVNIVWDTRIERGNHGFEIERRDVASAGWKTVGFVSATKSRTGGAHYTFTDKGSFEKVSYYRIKQISGSNSARYSESMMVLPTNFSEQFSVSRLVSPGGESAVMLSITLPEEREVAVRLVDVHGRARSTMLHPRVLPAGHHYFPISLHDVPGGVYLLKLESDGGVLTSTLLQ